MAQGRVKRAQPLLMAAGSDNAAGKLLVAGVPSGAPRPPTQIKTISYGAISHHEFCREQESAQI